jgi:hypothetical protein
MDGGLFSTQSDDLSFRKRRKATHCPKYCALIETVCDSDIDMKWFAEKADIPLGDDSETKEGNNGKKSAGNNNLSEPEM